MHGLIFVLKMLNDMISTSEAKPNEARQDTQSLRLNIYKGQIFTNNQFISNTNDIIHSCDRRLASYYTSDRR